VNQRAESTARQRQEAFAAYVVPELDLLLRVAVSQTRRSVDAEDLVQDTLMRAYQGIDRFDGAHPRAWLLTIMRNAQINRTRRRRPDLLDDQDAALDRLAASDGTGEPDPEALAVDRSFDVAVSDTFAALPKRFQEVVTLVDMDGLSYAEAAAALGVPVGTVMSQLHRARTKMRHRLTAAGFAPRRKR
jgi:RNA polymerase sigma-70 factor (ECF subfamily)